MSIFSKIKNVFGFSSENTKQLNFSLEYKGEKYDIAKITHVIQTSTDKGLVTAAVATPLAIVALGVKNGDENRARDLFLLTMSLVNNRNDDVFTLEDFWEVTTKINLKDFANKILGTQL